MVLPAPLTPRSCDNDGPFASPPCDHDGPLASPPFDTDKPCATLSFDTNKPCATPSFDSDEPITASLDADPSGAVPAPSPFALSTAELDTLEDLGDQIADLASAIHSATHRLLVLVAEFDRRRGWELGGHPTCAHWLAWRTGIDLGAAREKVRAARALEDLPAIGAAMAQGELSFSKVRALTRVASVDDEEELLALAHTRTAHQLERALRRWAGQRCRDDAERERLRHRSRCLSVFPDEEGMYLVRGRLEPEVAALLMRALEAAADALYWKGPDVADTEPATPEQRRADAMGLLCERALAAGLDLEGGGPEAPISGTRAERYQVVLHVEGPALRADAVPEEIGTEEDEERPGVAAEGSAGARSRRVAAEVYDDARPRVAAEVHADALPRVAAEVHADARPRVAVEMSADARHVAAELSADPRPHVAAEVSGRSGADPGVPLAELADGTRLTPATAQRLACDAGLVRLATDARGNVLDVGRRTRTIPPALRRALEIRDGGCRFPGCGRRFTD
ncbi:MAG: DUF222 domain-containing protein, partial [Gemmatimonadota bacterium]